MKPARPQPEALTVGLVFETFDTYPSPPDAPPDVHAEYEPLETVELLEDAIAHLGHGSCRLGGPGEVLSAAAARA